MSTFCLKKKENNILYVFATIYFYFSTLKKWSKRIVGACDKNGSKNIFNIQKTSYSSKSCFTVAIRNSLRLYHTIFAVNFCALCTGDWTAIRTAPHHIQYVDNHNQYPSGKRLNCDGHSLDLKILMCGMSEEKTMKNKTSPLFTPKNFVFSI